MLRRGARPGQRCSEVGNSTGCVAGKGSCACVPMKELLLQSLSGRAAGKRLPRVRKSVESEKEGGKVYGHFPRNLSVMPMEQTRSSLSRNADEIANTVVHALATI